MAVIKEMVQCSQCTNSVLKSQAKSLDPLKRAGKYECFTCFKHNRLGNVYAPTQKKAATLEKLDLFCGHCKYKFRSKRLTCPYCGKTDSIYENKVTTVDLLA